MNLRGFPQRTLRGETQLYRIHRSGRSFWWFSSDGSGRFDPVGTKKGACYFAERRLGAWVEVLRKQMLLAEAEVQERLLARVQLGRDIRLADLTSRRALAFEVTAALGANEEYRESQEFAARALGARFGGVRYLLRHDPAQKLYGVVLFGEPGEPASDDRSWPLGEDGPIPEDLLEQARRAFGYRVVPTP